jgi:hypothetical protein
LCCFDCALRKEEGRRKREEGRGKKEEIREEGRRKKEEGRKLFLLTCFHQRKLDG